MPRKFQMSWDATNKVWYSRYGKGKEAKKKYHGSAKSKYRDDAGYEAALKNYHDWKKKTELKTKREVRREHMTMDSRGMHPEGTIAGLIDRYYRWQQGRVENKSIKRGRLYGVRRALILFRNWVGSEAYEPDGVRYKLAHGRNPHLHNFHIYLTRLIGEEKLKVATASIYWHDVKDMCMYADEKGWMPELPRSVRRLRFKTQVREYEIFYYNPEQIHRIFANFKPRKNSLPMPVMMALALNTGYTQTDIQDLKYSHIEFYKGWAVAIRKRRSKTKQLMRHKLWKVTAHLLMDYLHEHPKHNDDTIFLKPDGTTYLETRYRERRADENIMSMGIYVSDTIGKSFKRLAKKALAGEDIPAQFKLLRKSGSTAISKISTNDTIISEALYLGHRTPSVSRQHYTKIELPVLDDVLDKLEKHFNLDEYIPKRRRNYPTPPPELYED